MEGFEPRLEEALSDYRETYLAARNLAPRTRAEYLADLTDLITFLEHHCNVTWPGQVGKNHLENYLAELDRRGMAGSTRRRKVASIHSLFSYFEENGLIRVNPALRLVPPARESRQPRVLTEQEYRRLQDACRYHPRDQAIIELLLQTGMRLSELTSLTIDDIELPARHGKDRDHAGAVHVNGKGRKQRTVSLNWKASQALRAYLDQRRKPEQGAVFMSKFGEPLGPRAVQDLVKKYLRGAGIRGASVHSLRHTFGTHMVRKGTNLRVVQEALGHASLKTTSIYVSLSRELMDEQLQNNAL